MSGRRPPEPPRHASPDNRIVRLEARVREAIDAVEAPADHADTPVHLGRLGRIVAAVLWPSFLSAGVATFLFFGQIDPETLRVATHPDWEISREVGYTLGFAMFWGVTTLASMLTALLLVQRLRRPLVPPEAP